MMKWIEDRLNEYYKWLKDNTVVKMDDLTNWVSITTPFIGLFNDNIEIYAKEDNGNIILSDDGDTIRNLTLLGFEFTRSPKRKQYIQRILLNYGIKINDKNELYVFTTPDRFAQSKHNLIQAISEMGDLEYLSQHRVETVFYEDVGKYLEEQDVIFSREFIARGNTGLDYTFDYHIAGKQTEVIIRSFNSLTQSNVESFLFRWNDIKQHRQEQSRKTLNGLAIINDRYTPPKTELVDAVSSYGANIIYWSNRLSDQALSLIHPS